MRAVEERRPEGEGAAGRDHDRRPTRLAVAVSGQITTVRILSPIYNRLRALPPGSAVLLRRPRLTEPAFYENTIAGIAANLDLAVEWFAPEPGGRDQTYRRDFEFVQSADVVEAYFDVYSIMEGGTGHVVEAALARGVPVYAWAIDSRGQIERVGEIEQYAE